jgi:orotidine-5'-phosphate decarboxylase
VVEDYSHSLVEELVKLSEELEFMIFEDRKFADIGKIHQAHLIVESR